MDVKVSPDILAGFGPGTTLAISLEPKGGSKTGAPTGPVVAAGKAAQI
jgi:anti-sigma-K factor RskA